MKPRLYMTMMQEEAPKKKTTPYDRQIRSIFYDLKARRQAAGLSVTELANRMGANRQCLADAENGLSGMTLQRMFEMADALGLTVSVKFDGKDAENNPARVMLNSLEIFRYIPKEAKDLILTFLSNRADVLLLDDRSPAKRRLIEACESSILELLSIYVPVTDLEVACDALLG